jgi:hypothetical protein
MCISRRQFLLSTAGAAAGAILPSFYVRALEFTEQFGEALLQAPPRFDQDLIAMDFGGEGFHLVAGDPFAEPEFGLSFREFFTRYEPEGFDDFEYKWDMDASHLDDLIPDRYVQASWDLHDGPLAKGYHLLEHLDLGPELSGPDAVGGIELIQGQYPGSNDTWAQADDLVSVSLLQKRLNDLGAGIRVVLGYAV